MTAASVRPGLPLSPHQLHLLHLKKIRMHRYWNIGLFSCPMLENLWDSQGGNPHAAFMAAEIATAESGGRPSAISPTNDYGLWQINGSWGRLASLDPVVNARSAIAISDNGTDWYPWTTYVQDLYIGRCL